MFELNHELLTLLRNQLQSFPFHNLAQLLNKETLNGGTCFDHALKLRSELIGRGFEATLHEAEVCLTGDKSHRLVRVVFRNEVFFLDTGSGWPTLYQARLSDVEHENTTAGIHFRILREQGDLLIKRYDGLKWRDMNRISVAKQNEESILAKFPNRYLKPLPYSNELRLSWLQNEQFHRVSGFNLALYQSGKPCQECRLTPSELISYVHAHFPELTPDLSMYLKSIN